MESFGSSLPSYPTEWDENRLKILWENLIGYESQNDGGEGTGVLLY